MGPSFRRWGCVLPREREGEAWVSRAPRPPSLLPSGPVWLPLRGEQKVPSAHRGLYAVFDSQAALKKYQTEQRSKGDALDKCQAELKKLRKKSQGSKNPQKYSDKELQVGQVAGLRGLQVGQVAGAAGAPGARLWPGGGPLASSAEEALPS